jgi:hypothetical protein
MGRKKLTKERTVGNLHMKSRWINCQRREMNYKLFFCIKLLFCWLWLLFTFVINLHFKVIHHTNITIWDIFKFLIKKYWEKSNNHSPEKRNPIIPVSYQVQYSQT